ncbi:MAG TPA: hypothetical protein VGD43_04635 [Micromonospora sp.]
MRPSQLRRRCERVARTVRVPQPFDVGEFLDLLGTERGRPVHLIPFDLPAGAPCGLCVCTPVADYVVVTAAASGAQRDHIVLHETAHLLLRHSSRLLAGDCSDGQLFRHLDLRVVEAMFARTNYDDVDEREAETLASLLGQRAGLWRPQAVHRPADPLIERLGRSLERGPDRG